MTKPDDIPQDVWIAARDIAKHQYEGDSRAYGRVIRGQCDTWPIVKVAARAIMAEREACAQAVIAFSVEENFGEWFKHGLYPTQSAAQKEIAAAIRNRSEG